MKCDVCGKEISANRSTKRYCSSTCRARKALEAKRLDNKAKRLDENGLSAKQEYMPDILERIMNSKTKEEIREWDQLDMLNNLVAEFNGYFIYRNEKFIYMQR